MRFLSVGFVLLMILEGLAFGFALPYYLGRRLPGFIWGMAAATPVTLLGSMMIAYLGGGWGEELLGTALGVPFGLFWGCLAGAFVLNCIAGGGGAIMAALWRMVAGRSGRRQRPD